MHINTLEYYDRNAPRLSERYQGQNVSPLNSVFHRWLSPGMEVLEIGCGSGRDAQHMTSLGCKVTATDASKAMLEQAREIAQAKSKSPVYIQADFPLSENHELLKDPFDSVVAIAVLMHIPDNELFQFAYQIRSLLRNKGIFICSFCCGRQPDMNDPRLFVNREPVEVQLLFERIGFRLLAKEENSDSSERDFVWTTLVLSFDGALGLRPIDQIESIINRDNKNATYKLALLRALCEIAQTTYHHIQWHTGEKVSLPLGLIAEKWLYYYWPLLESRFFLPEMRCGSRAKGLAFRPSFDRLIKEFAGVGGLNAFHALYQNGKMTDLQSNFFTQTLNDIARTIVKGPVTYSGGSLESSEAVFAHQPGQKLKKCFSPGDLIPTLGRVYFSANLWREMCLVGHWIGQAIILRWAELSFEIAKSKVSVSDILSRLIILPETERNVSEIKNFFREIPDLTCVWSNQKLKNNRFDLDHVIPFSLWHNNELWNLLPTAPKVNNNKRDKIVGRKTLSESEERLVYYWRSEMKAFPQRFTGEMSRTLLGGKFDEKNWEKQGLASLHEAIELVSLQRGVERWDFGSFKASTRSQGRESIIPDVGVINNLETTEKKNDFRIFPFSEVGDQAFERFLPLVAEMAAGTFSNGFHTENLEQNENLDWIEVPSEMCRSNRFVVRVAGDSMEPRFQIGDLLVFEYHRSPQLNGQIVLAANFASGEGAGEHAVKRFRSDPEMWIFESENPKYSPIKIPKNETNYPILGTFVGSVGASMPRLLPIANGKL